ncbi:wax ester/triacylglycerol synthase family O-acyltransferase [Desulfobacterales bacterium HSG2]|nr:wax ester/triacylglycerol synthase family O-acyltransferase [Desulfobacterales bacterium HSG2]
MAEPMTHADNFWLCTDDPTNLMVIAGFMEFDEILDFKRVCATLRHRLLFLDRFKKRVVMPISGGVPEWEADSHFDIRSHLHRVALPAAGDRKALQEMIGDLMTVPLDQTKPLWQAHLIEDYGEGCAVFFRIHHCIADGIALIRVLLSMTDTDPDAPWPEPKPEKAKKPPSFLSGLPFGSVTESVREVAGRTWNLGKKLTDKAMETVFNPFHLIELTKTGAGMAMDTAGVMARLALLPPHPPNSFRGQLGVRKGVAWTDPISLGNIRTVGGVIEATLNDVLIATITAALRRYLQKRDDKVDELELQVTVPVNIRKPGTEFELGNKFGLVWLALPVHIEDPVLRLREVRRRMERLRDAPDAFAGFSILNTLGISPAKVAKKAASFFASKSAAILTHLPGPRQPLWFSGKEIRNMMFWVPGAGRVGLGISILSYDGRVTVGLVTDAGLVPDPETILEGFEEDFHYHSDLVKSL